MSSAAGEIERRERIAALAWDYAARALEPVRDCNLCGTSAAVELSRTDRYGYATSCRSCLRCGLVWLSPRLTADEYAEFYAVAYRPLVSAYHGRVIDAETVQVEQRDYATELVGFLSRSLPAPPATVLDVGGSTGVVAGALGAAFESRATILDPSPDELAKAEARGLETIAGFAEDVELGGRHFDLVLLCQTIDHLLDVGSTLRSIRGWIASGGHAFVDVLDFEFMAIRRGSIEGAVKIDHPFSLTRPTALAFFTQAGLRPVAERLSDDGHLGFLLEPTEPAEPDWETLGEHGDRLRSRLWRLRARS